MSGESLRVMILRAVSTVTVVSNEGSPSIDCQPSANAWRAGGAERPEALDGVPRPRRRSRSTAVPRNSPAGATEGAGTGGRRKGGAGRSEEQTAELQSRFW